MLINNIYGRDGKEFKVVSYYKIKEEVLNKDYIDVFSSKAQGKDVKCYDYYVKSIMPTIRSGLDYEDYAKLGVVKGKINTYGEKNLNKDQQKLLNLNIAARVKKI